MKKKWSTVEALVGSDKRLALVAKERVAHFEDREAALDGKAMVVCMSRRICVKLYDEIARLRPDWHSADDSAGAIKIVMMARQATRRRGSNTLATRLGVICWPPPIRDAVLALSKAFKAGVCIRRSPRNPGRGRFFPGDSCGAGQQHGLA